mmetsp:Transcript_20992/g.49206  ORF Transcript_20992/g.49206 Transcript_20992/m.49206 type:complete len:236 (-) Transcript_20992:1783-2490(-)
MSRQLLNQAALQLGWQLLDPEEDLRRNHQRNAAEHERRHGESEVGVVCHRRPKIRAGEQNLIEHVTDLESRRGRTRPGRGKELFHRDPVRIGAVVLLLLRLGSDVLPNGGRLMADGPTAAPQTHQAHQSPKKLQPAILPAQRCLLIQCSAIVPQLDVAHDRKRCHEHEQIESVASVCLTEHLPESSREALASLLALETRQAKSNAGTCKGEVEGTAEAGRHAHDIRRRQLRARAE